MGARKYYFLVASLPKLEHFERAERLPINPERLEQRLRALEPDDAAQLSRARGVIRWEQSPLSRTTEQVARRYQLVVEQTSNPALRMFVESVMDRRTILVALRRRETGLAAPGEGEQWGVGHYVRRIRQRWDDPDFGLAMIHPWIDEARTHIHAADAVSLERLMMSTAWDQLTRIAESLPFGFEQVFAFVFKWEILRHRLSYDQDAAKLRFQELIQEVIGEQQQYFE
jgi:hypothetical protein